MQLYWIVVPTKSLGSDSVRVECSTCPGSVQYITNEGNQKRRHSWEGWHLNLLKVKVPKTLISKDTQLCLTHSSHRTEAACSSSGPPDRSGFHCPPGRTPGRTDTWYELRAPAPREKWSSSRSGSQRGLDTSRCVTPLKTRAKLFNLFYSSHRKSLCWLHLIDIINRKTIQEDSKTNCHHFTSMYIYIYIPHRTMTPKLN